MGDAWCVNSCKADGFLQCFWPAAEYGHAPALLRLFQGDGLSNAAAGSGDNNCFVHDDKCRVLKNAATGSQFHPVPRLRRSHSRIHDRKRASTIMKAWDTRTLVADGVHEFPRLIVTKGRERIALAWIAR